MDLVLVLILIVMLVNSAWILARFDKINNSLSAILEELKSNKKEQ